MIKNYLIADIGGTNSRTAILTIKNKKQKISKLKKYKTSNFKTLSTLLTTYLNDSKQKNQTNKAIIAIAGNTNNKPIKLTNSKIKLNTKETQNQLNLNKIIIINDFTATAYAIEKLKPKHIKTINKGKKTKNKTKIVLGAGTGLGKAIIAYDEKTNQNIIIPSEGGHSEFPYTNNFEFQLIEFIKKKENKNIIEQEDLLSGKGIERIYEFLSKQNLTAKEISEQQNKNKFAKQTFELFYKFYARIAKNFALDELAESGVYLAGGIITKNPLSKKQFIKEFTKNQTYSLILQKIPIYIIKEENINLIGITNYIEKNNI